MCLCSCLWGSLVNWTWVKRSPKEKNKFFICFSSWFWWTEPLLSHNRGGSTGMGYLHQQHCQKKMLAKLFLGRFIWQQWIVLNPWINLSTLCKISILSSYIYQNMPYPTLKKYRNCIGRLGIGRRGTSNHHWTFHLWNGRMLPLRCEPAAAFQHHPPKTPDWR